MGFYKSPADMYAAREKRFKQEADLHWALAKNGDGGYHYGKARFCYEQARVNHEKAEKALVSGAVFSRPSRH